MKTYINSEKPKWTSYELSKTNAIHEAGYATALYLGSLKNRLPIPHFKISIKSIYCSLKLPEILGKPFEKYVANVEGGRYIKCLPGDITSIKQPIEEPLTSNFNKSIEADIFSLMVGPLSVAKYVALNDNEIINNNLINFNALHYYGGFSEIMLINKYVYHFIDNEEQRNNKINELFFLAYTFVNDIKNWKAICNLANFILNHNQNNIELDTIINILENSLKKTNA